MTTLEIVMMILILIGILVYCGGLILIKEDSNLKFWWIEIGTWIFLLYLVICMIIYPIDEHNNHTNHQSDPTIYVFPTYPY